jgi:S-(hydroxymethyl)glutathione dehydrogenase/alcohol dehydrogenase
VRRVPTDLALAEGVWGGELPAVYGHEAAGVVEAVRPGVTHTGAGDHVVVTLVPSCGSCALCRRGLPGLCERRLDLPPSPTPLHTTDGRPVVQGLRTAAFAERVLVHVRFLAVSSICIDASWRFAKNAERPDYRLRQC